jgi:hypothetical protein
MTNVIDFLERLGQDARLRYASAEELDRVLIGAQIDPALRAALLGEDQRQLEALLGAATNVCCMVHAPEDDEEETEDDEGEEEDDGDDQGDEDLKSRQSASRRAASI